MPKKEGAVPFDRSRHLISARCAMPPGEHRSRVRPRQPRQAGTALGRVVPCVEIGRVSPVALAAS